MKTMKSFKYAIAPKIHMAIGSFLVGTAFLSTNCLVQTPARAGIIAQGHSQPSKEVPLEKFLGYYQFPNKVAFVQFELKDNALFAQWNDKAYQYYTLVG